MSKRILIVDDAAFMREMLRDLLTEEGFEIAAEAADGDEAVAAYAEYTPDLVMLDIVMPRKSGLEALREIVASDADATVVMCSALGQESLVMEALDAGAKDFVVKPFKPDRAIEVVKKVLQKAD
ncbi:MAG: response regulator [Deltaproteobacteria bacterium]|jgi:two-component system chemotaxis response regulator CheY|nr:response regulator [Deltaproteobacteria bacterium]MBW2414695.1 response regulator [Deltaproteobacteria bacterium]